MFFTKKPNINKFSGSFLKEGIVFTASIAPEQIAYLNQLTGIGLVTTQNGSYLIRWPDFYDLSENIEHSQSLPLLGLPEWSEARPVLSSSGALTDSTFQINLEGWHYPKGGQIRGILPIKGGMIEINKQPALLRKPVWKLLDAISQFANSPHTVETNYQHWGKIRRLALAAGANLDDFLSKTIVLTPETLNLELERLDKQAIRIKPTFEDAPTDWLERFDHLTSIPDYYNLSQPGGGLIHVAISPPVKKVLNEIKRMPGRTVRGKRAQAFIRNPYAVLGEAAESVMPPDTYQAALQHADIVFYTFDISAKTDSKENILSVTLDIEATRSGVIPAFELFVFDSAEALLRLIDEIQRQWQEGFPCFNWQGYEIELRGDTEEKLNKLQAWHERWLNPVPVITYEEIYGFPDYAERVIKIGECAPYYSPFICKTEEQSPWLDTSVLVGIGTTPDNPILAIRTQDDLEQLKTATAQAKAAGQTDFEYPGLEKPIPVIEAEEIIPIIQRVIDAKREGNAPPDRIKKSPTPRKGLIIETNLQAVGYTENPGSQSWSFNKNCTERLELPATLKATLKDHQRTGIAWLQHLWRSHYSGGVMADDMGLGKTLQLLTFIVWYLEQPGALPVLIVAPVSLLENWQNEIKKFFAPNCARILTLYGKSLAQKKLPQTAIDQRLLDDGLNRFLVDNWIENANLVLTTYETLRDLSISLGQQAWGIMVCDEAQKIKTPGTLVTDAAKAQKASFKISCTGTPVENSLTDLWCLFDFVQPGLLGPLNRFGLTYRRPIENAHGNAALNTALAHLRFLIEPQLLRRTKREVAKDLPVKYDDTHEAIRRKNRILLNDYQRKLYNEVIIDYQRIMQAASLHEQRNNPILTVLHRLRAICADPRPVGLRADLKLSVKEYRKQSPKFNWLIERLDEIKARDQGQGEKVLIFTEYLDLQRALQHYLKLHYQISPRIINGSIKSTSEAPESRQKLIDEFQASHGFNVLILSPKAAGFGLNIQAANHVIHYTRPWNPAVEDQATDRAYRIGQTKDVYVYYPTVVSNDLLTFEAKLDDLLRCKRELAGDMLNGTPTVSQEELADLLHTVAPSKGCYSEEFIKAQHLPRIIGRSFEKLCRALWTSQGYRCLETPVTGDGGVDIIAIKGKRGLLIQCKSSETDKGLGWDAVKEVVAGSATYEHQFPGIEFNKVAVTNQFFNSATIRHAELNKVTLIDGVMLKEWLIRYPQTHSAIA